MSFNQNLLRSVGKEALYPLQKVTPNSIVVQFDGMTLVTNLFEGLTEIQ